MVTGLIHILILELSESIDNTSWVIKNCVTVFLSYILNNQHIYMYMYIDVVGYVI